MAKSANQKVFPKSQVSAAIRRMIESTPAAEFQLACSLPSALLVLAGLAGVERHYGSVYRELQLEALRLSAASLVERCLKTVWYADQAAVYSERVNHRDPMSLYNLANACVLAHPVIPCMPRSAWAFPKEMLHVVHVLCGQHTVPGLDRMVQAVLSVQIDGCIEPDPESEPEIVSLGRSVWMVRQYWNEVRDTAIYLSDCRVNIVPSPFDHMLVSVERRIERSVRRLPVTHPLVARFGDMRRLIGTMLSGDDSLARTWLEWTYPLIQQIQVDVERASTSLGAVQYKQTDPERVFFSMCRDIREQTKELEREAYSEIRSGRIKGVPWEGDIDKKLTELRERERALDAVNIATRADSTHVACRNGSRPIVNMAEFTVSLGENVCMLGNGLSLRIVARLVSANERFVSHRDLVDAAWGRNSENVSEQAVRTAISRLRQKLKASGMADVLIDGTEMGHYRLIVQENQL